MDQSINIVIADDHQIFREGLARLLTSEKDISLIGEVDNGDDLLELVKEHDPDVAIIDISMPGPGADGIVNAIDAMDVKTETLALTMHLEPSLAQRLLALGISGYVIKEAAFDELVSGVKAVANGDQYICNAMLGRIEDNSSTRNLPSLTDREYECLQMAASGDTAKMIANKIGITERTVRFHFSNICQKFEVHRRSEAIALAIKSGILSF
jgi:DNA-binding NarL/FixJ family response regulator